MTFRFAVASVVASLAAVATVAIATHVDAAEKPLTIAIYAPNAPFDSGTERYAFVNRLAQQV
ncbi:MAG TPA: hypothetical protein VIA18_14920, partial [Polyangia bacterium]|nr:hypothetical protein [Polyangia bacterium]